MNKERITVIDKLISDLQAEKNILFNLDYQETIELFLNDICNTSWELHVAFAQMLNSGHTFEIRCKKDSRTYNRLEQYFTYYYIDAENLHIVRDRAEGYINISGTPENVLKFIRKYNLKVDLKDNKLVVDMHFKNIAEIYKFMKEINNE